MTRSELRNDYFEWLSGIIHDGIFAEGVGYRKLLTHLHDVEFTYLIPRDKNRAENGISLRWRFACEVAYGAQRNSIVYDLDGPCSVLEMMVSLAIGCEETIMDDPRVGDRTGQWFWGMITSLGLGSMTDYSYDSKFVDKVLQRFLDREYAPNGKGGLFTIRNCEYDLRTVEIWVQQCWYLDSIM